MITNISSCPCNLKNIVTKDLWCLHNGKFSSLYWLILRYFKLKAFNDFKNKQKSVWSNVFLICKSIHILWKCIQYTIHWDKTQILKKNPLDKINCTKKPYLFFREVQLITVLLLICDSYMTWSTRFVSLRLRVRFSIFDSIPFLLQFIFLFNKIHGLFDFKTL